MALREKGQEGKMNHMTKHLEGKKEKFKLDQSSQLESQCIGNYFKYQENVPVVK